MTANVRERGGQRLGRMPLIKKELWNLRAVHLPFLHGPTLHQFASPAPFPRPDTVDQTSHQPAIRSEGGETSDGCCSDGAHAMQRMARHSWRLSREAAWPWK